MRQKGHRVSQDCTFPPELLFALLFMFQLAWMRGPPSLLSAPFLCVWCSDVLFVCRIVVGFALGFTGGRSPFCAFLSALSAVLSGELCGQRDMQ